MNWSSILSLYFVVYGGAAAAAAAGLPGYATYLPSWVPQLGTEYEYTFESTVRLNDAGNAEEDVAFRTLGNVLLSVLWQNEQNKGDAIFEVRITPSKLLAHSGSNKTTTTDFDKVKNDPLLVHWNNNRIERIYINSEESISLKNIKKAICSLFQFHLTNARIEEMDICGLCSATYEILNTKTILKTKHTCLTNLPSSQHSESEEILGADTQVERKVLYQLGDDLKTIAKITSQEDISIRLAIKQEIGVSANALMHLNFVGSRTRESTTVFGGGVKTAEEAVYELTRTLHLNLKPEALYMAQESYRSGLKSLTTTVKEKRNLLKSDFLGSVKSAEAFLKVYRAALLSTENEISKVLTDKKNEQILNQLMDVFGTVQSLEAHKAVMKTFDFVNAKNLEPIERYLWALSLGRKSKVELYFVEDIKRIVEKKPNDEKLLESLLLTLTSIAHKFNHHVMQDVFDFITAQLSTCPEDEDPCRVMYIRCLKNLKFANSKSLLLEYALNGTRVVSVAAMKVLYSLPKHAWDSQVLREAEKIYYQKNKKYDSSARAIAVDILIEADPSVDTLRHLLKSLLLDTSYELRKYLLQRLNQIASTNHTFSEQLKSLIHKEKLNHYGVMAQRGLSNALTTKFLKDGSVNASLFCINEISKSVLKRSHVSISLEKNHHALNLFSLDMFTGGLSSFLWSDDTSAEEELDEAEYLTSGMEITVFGTQIRPFVFFSGHGELMGHLWAGTASERTTALQALVLLQEITQFIPMATGNLLRFDVLGGSSFDLAGQIQFSLWNRNAHSFVEAMVGVAIEGTVNISSSFIRNGYSFKAHSQQKIEMTADLSFYDEVDFCLQISQTNSTIRFEGEKYQKFTNATAAAEDYKSSEYFQMSTPGLTYALNKKTNDMCNRIFRGQHKAE